MENLTRLITFGAFAASTFTLSSCADRTERFEARQELKIARIERLQDRLAAEEQRRQEKRERE
jgi:hypothetical protein